MIDSTNVHSLVSIYIVWFGITIFEIFLQKIVHCCHYVLEPVSLKPTKPSIYFVVVINCVKLMNDDEHNVL